jgi:hypothetical protein
MTVDLYKITRKCHGVLVVTDIADVDGGIIYGGTLEFFQNMIAQHALGLGRPNYSPPVPKSS